MLVNLIKYEFNKVWKNSMFILLGYGVLQVILLILIRTLFWNDSIMKSFVEKGSSNNIGVTFGICMFAFFFLAILLIFYPFIESLSRYGRDLSGKQAVLELMIPVNSSKKIISKLIVTICNTILCIAISLISIILFVLVNSNFNKVIINAAIDSISKITPMTGIVFIIYLLFSFASTYMIFFFCIAFSKTFSHKNKIAVPIGILTFVGLVTVTSIINNFLEKNPIVSYHLFGVSSSLSSTIFDIVLFAIAFVATSWLMEKKIEL